MKDRLKSLPSYAGLGLMALVNLISYQTGALNIILSLVAVF